MLCSNQIPSPGLFSTYIHPPKTSTVLTTIIFSSTSGTLQSFSFQTNYICMVLGGFYFLRAFHTHRCTIRPNPTVSLVIRRALSSLLAAATT
jgi:dihydroceramidase